MEEIVRKVHVNIPFTMLQESYLALFIRHRLNPEIGLDARALDTFSRDEFARVAARLGDHGLQVTFHAPFLDLSPGSPDPEIRAVTRRRFSQVLALVPLFRPRTIVCHPGFDWRRYGFIREEWLAESLEFWGGLAAEAGRQGTRLMLENVYEEGPGEMEPLFEALQGQGVGFCLDIGHQAVFSRTPLAGWLERLGPFIGQLHLHDNHGLRDDHLGLGRGSIDCRPLLDYLRAAPIDPPVITLEPHTEAELWPSLEFLARHRPW